jgi:pyruvate carboxylase
LRPQARGLGLEDQFETIKKNYKIVNDLLGGIVKVTPSSKVVGDMAMFMTSNNLTKADILKKKNLAFPESVKNLMRGDLGQIAGGFPKKIQSIILKGEKPYTDRPNAHLEPIDFKAGLEAFQKKYKENLGERDFISSELYPKVYEDFFNYTQEFGDVSKLSTAAYFYGLRPNEEIMVEIGLGKNILIKYLNMTEPNEQGNRLVFFSINGQTRSIEIRDEKIKTEIVANKKVEKDKDIGAPLQGSLAKILVEEGDKVKENTPLFIIEAMKMESTITSPRAGIVKKVHLSERTLVEQDDLIVELK